MASKTDKGAGAREKERRMAQAGAKAPTKDVPAAEADAPARPRVGPFKFLQQVRQEVSKVTWPSRQETTVTTIMVFVMVIVSAIFFLLVDQILGTAIKFVLQLGS